MPRLGLHKILKTSWSVKIIGRESSEIIVQLK
jgi:hypothetical protein